MHSLEHWVEILTEGQFFIFMLLLFHIFLRLPLMLREIHEKKKLH